MANRAKNYGPTFSPIHAAAHPNYSPVGAKQDPSPARQPAVVEQLERLANTVQQLRTHACELQDGLARVLTRQDSPTATETKDVPDLGVPLANDLQALNITLRGILDIIEDTRQRVEV